MHPSKKLLTIASAAVLGMALSLPAYAQTNSESLGPAFANLEQKADTQESDSVLSKTTYTKGKSLGIFTTSGYCACSSCSGTNTLTYSGTVPQADHTISADLTVLPLGTKVFIGDIVYTVEDMGSGVDGNLIDIFYATHEDAWNHGLQEQEVFLAEYHRQTTCKREGLSAKVPADHLLFFDEKIFRQNTPLNRPCNTAHPKT